MHDERDIQDFFELTYANYLAIPRSILQSMTIDWQRKFVKLLDELDETFDWRREGCEVTFQDNHGKLMNDAFAYYDRGRTIWTPEEVRQAQEKHNKLQE